MDSTPILAGKEIRISTRRVEIQDGQILWQTDADRKRVRAPSPYKPFGSTLLDDFIFLADKPDDLLRTFARRYGPLGLCKHGFSMGHRKTDFNTRCYEFDRTAEDIGRGLRARESVQGWRRYIARADGVLVVAGKLHRKEPTTEEDWSWLFDEIPHPKPDHARVWNEMAAPFQFLGTRDARPYVALVTARKGGTLAVNPLRVVLAAHRRDTPEQQRQALANAVNLWFDECEAGLCLAWPTSGIELRLGLSDPLGRGNRLLVAIGVQLLHAVLEKKGYARCFHCGHSYKPSRKPRDGEKPCCGDADCRRLANRMHQSEFKLRQSTSQRK